MYIYIFKTMFIYIYKRVIKINKLVLLLVRICKNHTATNTGNEPGNTNTIDVYNIKYITINTTHTTLGHVGMLSRK